MDNSKASILRTLSVKVRDKHSAILSRMAFEANQVWNAANKETATWCYIPVPEVGYIRNPIGAFELQKQLKGIREEQGFIIHSTTVQEVIAVHAKSRKQFRKDKLRWRVSGGVRRSLGWVPFKSGAVSWKNGQAYFAGHYFKVWDSYGLSGYRFRSGSFSEDARGRWYLNIIVELLEQTGVGSGQVGIDLGLKDTATCSNSEKLQRGGFYRDSEQKLAKAQRARQKKRVKNIHAKIKNRRKDALHKFSTRLVKDNALIVVGNVSSSGLAKTKMAKSVLDAGWAILKTQLDYKSKGMRVVFMVVDEKYTTQTCSCCGSISDSSPKGRAGLRIREWTCARCGTLHDRDINAARNILAAGHGRLAGGIPGR
ncbi:MAG TPA: transposase [Methylobacter sp.]